MLSLRSIRREADMHVSASMAIHARSFGTEVPQDDADQELASWTQSIVSIIAINL